MFEISQLGNMGFGTPFFAVLMAWVFIWKGLALWKAARNGSKVWFIILLLINTIGILEIIYLFAVKPRWGLNLKAKE
ncbi:MAG: hypothetical protein QG580_140 [Patescibacteria group bacterium]|jgi:hypothetical protein|nr:hypothetical protein [Patescibacteria group bacterium]